MNNKHGIPTRHAASFRRTVAATALIFSVAVSVAVVAAPTSAAKQNWGHPGVQAFTDCFSTAWDKNRSMSYATKQKVAEDCCLNVGGIFNESTHTCYLPADNITVEEPEPPVPPPGATAILPPGLNTTGIQ